MGEKGYYSKLCGSYLAVGNIEGFVNAWPQSDNDTKVKYFGQYKNEVKDAISTKEMLKICDSILAIDADNVDALSFKAVSLYDDCEAKYRKLMGDYEKNKNATSYAILKRDLKFLSTDYRQCRDMFEKLRVLMPDSKNNIKYLINIYNRLDQNEKARQLEKLL
jgi:hypothetical protein